MGLIDKLHDTFGYEPVDSKRTANNKKVVDALTIEDDMNRFIREDAMGDAELNRKIHVMFKQIRQRNAEVSTRMELFLDNWAFQHGGLTKDNYRDACRALVRYAASVRKRATRNREAQENSVDPDGMQDFPL